MASSKTRPVRKEGDETPGQFTDPAFKKISHINGEVNRMTKQELKDKLEELRLDTKGVKEVLRKRLKNYYKKRVLHKVVQPPAYSNVPDYDFYMVIDFEATCQENNGPDFQHEIIEFPIVLIEASEKKVIDVFHTYVQPVLNPKLTEFCTSLTGITQFQVSKAPLFPSVLEQVEEWKDKHRLGEAGRDFAVLSDGPWDMSRFLHMQCDLSGLPFPRWGLKWVNVRKAYANFYQCKKMKLKDMMEHQGLPFVGTLHSGIDDSKNIATIAIKMLQDGAKLRVNERLVLETSQAGYRLVKVQNVTSSMRRGRQMSNIQKQDTPAEEEEDQENKPELAAMAQSLSNLDVKESDWNVVKSKKDKSIEKEEELGNDDGEDDDLLYYHKLQNRDGRKVKFEYDFGNH